MPTGEVRVGARLHPVEGHVVAPAGAHAVVAAPFDGLTSSQRTAMAAADPRSFVSVLPPGPAAEADLEHTLRACRRNLDRLLADGHFVPLPAPSLAVVAHTVAGRRSVAVVGDLDVAAFEDGTVRPHERVRPDRVTQLVRYLEVVGVTGSPVTLTHRPHAPLREAAAAVTARPPLVAFRGDDGEDLALWLVEDAGEQAAIADAVSAAGTLYVADGHHRAAAAAAHATRTGAADGASRRVLTALLPCDHLRVRPFHRLLHPVPHLTVDAVLGVLAETGLDPDPHDGPWVPDEAGWCGLTVAGRWWRVDLRAHHVAGPVEGLDVRLVERTVVGPLLGTDSPAGDARVTAVPAAAGPAALVRDEAVGLTLPAPGIEAVLRVADAGEVMPAKTTFVEPKLHSGLLLSRR